MNVSQESERRLVERVRQGEELAWNELISQFEGRLLAFVQGRLPRKDQAEDVVQETFIGFVTSLPNYDSSRSLESYLFSIAAYKLTDFLRKEGRRPTLSLTAPTSNHPGGEPVGSARRASSLYLSREKKALEEQALVAAIQKQLQHYRKRSDWEKLKTLELLFVKGTPNKEVAQILSLSEQQVANFKSEFLRRLRKEVPNGEQLDQLASDSDE
ncbi:ECF RNA polymerase sigma factor SigD [Planctomycetales bacterium 10988]|nr:ECF RNA polymerase sigma factor SigD [Planctomycetales bacterium 10988]